MAESRTRKPRRLSVPTTDPAAEAEQAPKRATRSRKKVADAPADAPTTEAAPAAAVEAEPVEKPKRATRSRKKVADAPTDAPTTGAAPAAAAPAESAESAATEDADGKPVKKGPVRRSRKAAAVPAAEAGAEVAADAEVPAAAVTAEKVGKKAPARRSRKAAAEAPAAEAGAEIAADAVAADEVAVEKPKRATRSRKQAAAAEAVEAAATEAADAKPAKKTPARRSRQAAAEAPAAEAGAKVAAAEAAEAEPVEKPKRATRSRKQAAAAEAADAPATDSPVAANAEAAQSPAAESSSIEVVEAEPAQQPKRATRSRRRMTVAPIDSAVAAPATSEQENPASAPEGDEEETEQDELLAEETEAENTAQLEEENPEEDEAAEQSLPAAALLFQAPDLSATRRRTRNRAVEPEQAEVSAAASATDETVEPAAPEETGEEQAGEEQAGEGEESTARSRRRRGSRGRRGRGRRGEEGAEESAESSEGAEAEASATQTAEEAEANEESSSRRRRRRRTREDSGRDEITALKGSTRLEAKRQRRKEGRQAGRKRQLITESEFLARRESVNRHMIVRERDGLNQIAVLEDGLLVEHYVARRTQASMVGSVVLGRVQNVLPTMEAAFVDIGQGRNAVLYAGEVNWDLVDAEGKPRKIEEALKAGDQVLVQVTKDPIGHKGARLTSQISLAGRFLVLVPGAGMTGISRKLPVGERNRLKAILKEVVPDGAGVIVRTAAEGASDEQLREDVARLQEQWEEIEAKRKKARSAPQVLRGEPELAVRVVRDIFNEDFSKLTVAGEGAWKTISGYVKEMSPDLVGRLEHFEGDGDVFAAFRVDEQLAKGMDRKVWLPSGGSLVIDRTEAMTVVDVNTGRFTGSGTLEETVTRNNLEAAEEIVRQLRLRDIGGIIVIDFVDMVLSQNRDLVLRRLVECLGRDRTRHQVTEVTSLGLVQMTRKRVGEGLVEAFSTQCECCAGRGFIVQDAPVELRSEEDEERGSRRRGDKRGDKRGERDEKRFERAEKSEKGERVERRRKDERSGNTAGEARARRARAEEAHVVMPDRAEMRERLARIAAAAAHAHEEADAAANAAEVAAGRPAEVADVAADAPAAPAKRAGGRTRRKLSVSAQDAAAQVGGDSVPVAAQAPARQAPAAVVAEGTTSAAPSGAEAGETAESSEPKPALAVSLSEPLPMRTTRRRRRGLSTGVLDPTAGERPKVELELPPAQETAPTAPKLEVEIDLPERPAQEFAPAVPKTRRRSVRKTKE